MALKTKHNNFHFQEKLYQRNRQRSGKAELSLQKQLKAKANMKAIKVLKEQKQFIENGLLPLTFLNQSCVEKKL